MRTHSHAVAVLMLCSCSAPAPWPGGPIVSPDDAPPQTRPEAAAVPEDARPAPDAAVEDEAPADAPACPAGWGECSPGACVNLATSAAHCSACGAACSPSWRCERGTCVSPSGTSCDPGRADCDRNESNGCEASLRSDHANCGACGNNCRERGLFCRGSVCAP